MKKLCIVNVMLSRGLGGIEQAVIDYSEALGYAGHKVYAVVHPDAAIIPQLQAKKIAYEILPNLGAWDVFAICKLRCLLKKLETDVAIAHGNRALSLLRYSARKRRLVAVMHNYKIKCKGLKAVFCPTHDLIRYTESQGVASQNIHHVPNLVRVSEDFITRKRHDPPIIGAMGRFVAKKGFDIFIESLVFLKQRNVIFKAVLAGGGEEEEKLKKLASDRGLSDILSFPGWVENKAEFFGSIDIFCLPSHHEPFGIVLLEAMAQSLPVISTDSEGPSEIISNGKDGILVTKNDMLALTDGLHELLSDPIEAQLLAINAFDTVKNNYDLPVISSKLDLALKGLEGL